MLTSCVLIRVSKKIKSSKNPKFSLGVLQRSKTKNHAMKNIAIIASVCIICFMMLLSKYDTWGISEGLCIYQDSSVAVILMLTGVLFLINCLSILTNKNRLAHAILMSISIGFFTYYHPIVHYHLVGLLLNHTSIQAEQLGQAAMCELQRMNDQIFIDQ